MDETAALFKARSDAQTAQPARLCRQPAKIDPATYPTCVLTGSPAGSSAVSGLPPITALPAWVPPSGTIGATWSTAGISAAVMVPAMHTACCCRRHAGQELHKAASSAHCVVIVSGAGSACPEEVNELGEGQRASRRSKHAPRPLAGVGQVWVWGGGSLCCGCRRGGAGGQARGQGFHHQGGGPVRGE